MKKAGFTTVELLITLFVASAFLISGFQLYIFVIKDGGEARAQAKASNVAYDYLQQYKANVTSPCTNQSIETDKAITVPNLSNATLTVTVTCPYAEAGGTFSATGGNISTVDGYIIHTFTTNGTFTPNSAGSIEALVVGGGGGGGDGSGSGYEAGGGGGGGVMYRSSFAVAGTIYPITVGAGGANCANGSNSIFSTLTAIGGGHGGTAPGAGTTGGSGGGGAHPATGGGAGTAGQGYAGGSGGTSRGGGGGGAGGTGGSYGLGGNGLQYSISGTPTYYGGGGGAYLDITGGLGGGGNSTIILEGASTAGADGTGGGGGGGYSVGYGGRAGGSGIVIIRYKTSTISKINVTIKYGNPQKAVSNATYATP